MVMARKILESQNGVFITFCRSGSSIYTPWNIIVLTIASSNPRADRRCSFQ